MSSEPHQCTRCGVILEAHLEECPLCGMVVGQLCDGDAIAPEAFPGYAPGATVRESPGKRVLLRRFLTILFSTAGLVVLAVALVTAGSSVGFPPRWVWITLLSLAAGWAVVTLPLRRLPWRRWFVLALLALQLLAFGLDLLTTPSGPGGANGLLAPLSWSVRLALPLLLVFGVVVLVVVRLVRRGPGTLRVAAVLVTAAVFSSGVDLVVRNYLHAPVGLGWSVIVLLSVVPLALLLLVLQVTVFRYVDIYRRLHL